MKQFAVTCLACASLIVIGCASKTNQSTTSRSEGHTSTAPSGQEAAKSKVALVRFVNAAPERASLDFGNMSLFSDVAYNTVTPYKEVPGERHDFKLVATGAHTKNGKPVTESEGLSNGARYTVIAALDKNGNEKLDVIDDNFSQPADGKSKVRVINASEKEVDVYAPVSTEGKEEGSADRAKHPDRNNPYANEDKWFSGVNAVSSTSFKDVAPYDGKLDIVSAGYNNRAQRAQATHVAMNMRPGDLYTVIVTGGGRHPLDAVKIDDHLDNANTNTANPNAR
jgi:hypothetical protein